MAVLWITAEDLAEPTSENAPLVAEAVSYALFMLSGQKYPGVREVTEWYGHRGTACWACTVPAGYEGVPQHGHRYYDSRPAGLRLRGKPIVSVVSVETAEGPLDPAQYSVINRAVLQLNGGCWDFNGGVTVTYSYGQYPPALGRLAAIRLGNQFLGLLDEGECDLPDYVTSVTQQGLSFSLKDPSALAALRKTGLYEVDLFLSTVNPTGALQPAKVFSPVARRGERRL